MERYPDPQADAGLRGRPDPSGHGARLLECHECNAERDFHFVLHKNGRDGRVQCAWCYATERGCTLEEAQRRFRKRTGIDRGHRVGAHRRSMAKEVFRRNRGRDAKNKYAHI